MKIPKTLTVLNKHRYRNIYIFTQRVSESASDCVCVSVFLLQTQCHHVDAQTGKCRP